MQIFYLTFGQTYREEHHPQGGHPDGWFEIMAPDYSTARDIAFRELGPKWCWLYEAEEFQKALGFYPLGCLKTLQ